MKNERKTSFTISAHGDSMRKRRERREVEEFVSFDGFVFLFPLQEESLNRFELFNGTAQFEFLIVHTGHVVEWVSRDAELRKKTTLGVKTLAWKVKENMTF